MPALTSLRFLAAAIVFLHHFPPADASWPLAIVAAQGHVGVTVFFVLSGFLITARYSETLRRGPRAVTLNQYFRKRVARIVPLYWTVLGLSLVLANGRLDFSWQVLPEWLLVQGFLSRSVHHLAVPTSWTLTLEECFYVLAPLVFLGVRRARASGALVLLAWTAALLGLGLLLVPLVDAERFQFLGSVQELMLHTIFGRFVEFALGVWGGRLYLSGSVGRAWARPRGGLAASLVGTAGIALVFAGQAGMTFAGGVDSSRWIFAWPFNLLVACGSLVLILSLTSSASLLSRALALPPFVYLGRVSYALYLVQLTPLGKGLLYRLIPADTPGFGLILYAGMTLVSAILFEWVEEPARRAVMRLWPAGRSEAPTATATARRRIAPAWAVTSLIVACALVQSAAWAGSRVEARRGLPTVQEAQRAAGSMRDRIVDLPSSRIASRATADGWRHRVPIPESWMIGTEEDRRAPPSLLVFADGHPVAFARRVADLEPSLAVAHYRGPRTTFVELQLPEGARPSRVTLVRHDPALATRLLASRLASSPSLLGVIACVLAGAGASAWLFHARWRPRTRSVATAALAAGALFLLLEVHEQAWAPVIIGGELLVLCGLAWARSRTAVRA
jgi:peptidoglycan/LPS O-acetylase OafA/YrhL